MALEILGLCMAIASLVCTIVFLPASLVIKIPLGVFAAYVVLETVLPRKFEDPGDGIRYEPDDD
jgi:hypothetical protein